jgi:hypothetical protein
MKTAANRIAATAMNTPERRRPSAVSSEKSVASRFWDEPPALACAPGSVETRPGITKAQL